ncbi:uncharacterized protein MONOS_18661 [Monocercomonoides exilis]|uniref:uncharacterized protein n=1 Tax=Monocercomonoides exilis TaxID=2049356 RepID=UPI00355A8EEF|nr:hypothetical protein MONOS_18661 [Monocercomonoides exilis]
MDTIFLILGLILSIIFPPAALLCFHFIPQMKVGYNFVIHFVVNIILCILFYLPGIIHALLIMFGIAQKFC